MRTFKNHLLYFYYHVKQSSSNSNELRTYLGPCKMQVLIHSASECGARMQLQLVQGPCFEYLEPGWLFLATGRKEI